MIVGIPTDKIECGLIKTDKISVGFPKDKYSALAYASYNLNPIMPVEIVRQTNCRNCGAVLHNNHCEYCGSEY